MEATIISVRVVRRRDSGRKGNVKVPGAAVRKVSIKDPTRAAPSTFQADIALRGLRCG
jgi:hypothetical protein